MVHTTVTGVKNAREIERRRQRIPQRDRERQRDRETEKGKGKGRSEIESFRLGSQGNERNRQKRETVPRIKINIYMILAYI